MRPDYQLRVFNAKVTGSFTVALLLCSHSCPPTLVPLFGDDGEGCGGWRVAPSSQDTSSPRTWRSSTISPSGLGPSLVVLERFPPQLGPWAYYSKWTGVPRSFGPTNTNYMNFSFWCLACIDALHIFTTSQISLLLSISKIKRRRILIFLLIPIAIFYPKKRSQLKHRLTLERERALLRIEVKIKPRKNEGNESRINIKLKGKSAKLWQKLPFV